MGSEFTGVWSVVLRPMLDEFPDQGARPGQHPAAGGALLVSNHSGRAVRRPIRSGPAVKFYDKFGYDRPIQYAEPRQLFIGPVANVFLA